MATALDPLPPAPDELSPLPPAPDEMDTRSPATRLYQDYFAKPATEVVGRAVEAATTPMVGVARLAQGEPASQAFGRDTWTSVGHGGVAQQSRTQTAANVVPQTPTQAGILAGTLLAGPAVSAATKAGLPLAETFAAYPALTRILAGTAGGATGGALEEGTPGAIRGGATGLVATGIGEGIGKGVQWAARVGPGGKAAVNEEAARRMADVAQTVNPEVGTAIGQAKAGLARTLHGPKTPAALQESVLGGSFQNAASSGMDRSMAALSARVPNMRLSGPGLQSAYQAMPDLAKQYTVGRIDPAGFTLEQAQAIRSWVGSKAFAASPVGQGVGAVPQQKLWEEATREITTALGPLASAWQKANQEYGGLMGLQEVLSQAHAFTGGPNQIALNMPAVQRYLSLNRQDLSRRAGPEAFNAIVRAAMGGGQLGTQDILAPGFGHALDALGQVYGRAQGGAPQILGSILRTPAPNIGSQYTGRAPLALPAPLQAIIDSLTGQTAERFRQGYAGAPTGAP